MRDFLTDPNNDLTIDDGDFILGESQNQHVKHIVEAQQGSFKQHPLIGVGVTQMLNGTITGVERRLVKLQLLSDGIAAKTVSFVDGKLVIQL